jgi:hypothetical protein
MNKVEDGFIESPAPTSSSSPGLKYDDGKPALGLYSGEFLCWQGAVLEFGRQKYTKDGVDGADNWRKGMKVRKLLGAIFRHTALVLMGEDLDKESGLPHLAHVAVDAMFVWETLRYRKQWDDRFVLPFDMPMVKPGVKQ